MDDSKSQIKGGLVLPRMHRKLWRYYVSQMITSNLQSFQSTCLIDAFSETSCNESNDWIKDSDSYGTTALALRVALDDIIATKNVNARFDQSRIKDFVSKELDEPLRKLEKFDPNDLPCKTITIYAINSKMERCLQIFQEVCVIFECFSIATSVHITQGEALTISTYDRHFPVALHILCSDFYNFTIPTLADKTRAVALISPTSPCRLPMSQITTFIKLKYELFIRFPLWFVERFVERFPVILLDMYGLSLPKEFATKDKRDVSGYVLNTLSFNSYGLHKTREEVLLKNYQRSISNRCSDQNVVAYDVVDTRTRSKMHLYHVMEDFSNFRAMKENVLESVVLENDTLYTGVQLIHGGKTQNITKSINNSSLADEIFEHFEGKKVKLSDIEEFIWLQTPFVFRKSALALMESEVNRRIVSVLNNLGVDPRRRVGIYPDGDLIVSFRSFSMDEQFEQLRS